MSSQNQNDDAQEEPTLDHPDGEQPTVPPTPVSDSDSTETITSQPDARPISSFGDYEVIEEVARGGMGVVYKARDKKLNRIVALKMIRSGQLASPEDRTRFQLEAEAAAQLDHPGITPIYEIGEYDSQPFFVMKLIEGGSLADRLDEYVGDPKKAAKLVADIALAVHHAHQRATLHRDLKPNNILLDEQGNPLVTDFGLAKMADRESGVTQTGAIMGTPGYMPPEQAASGKDVTTAADIYSLGAILFATLTGRPPFQGNTPMETVMQVVQQDAPKASSLNAKIPLELELICTKSLSRDPAERYASAEQLAHDLQRWLSGEPISVRPPTIRTLTKQFMKQTLRMTGGAVLVGIAIGLLMVPIMFFLSAGGHYQREGRAYASHFPSVQASLLSRWATSADAAMEKRFGDRASLLICVSAMLLIFCTFGLIVNWAAKPLDRNTAVSAGALAGMVSLGMGALFGGMLGPMSMVLGDTQADVGLLQSLAGGGPRDAAQQKAASVYPDLKERTNDQQATALVEKISVDLVSSIQTRLITSVAMFLTMLLPVLAMTGIAFSVKSHASSWLETICKYLESVIPLAAVSIAIITFFLSPLAGSGIPCPAWWRFAGMLISTLLIWWFAAKGAGLWLRVGLFTLFIASLIVFGLGVRAPGGNYGYVFRSTHNDSTVTRTVLGPSYVRYKAGHPVNAVPGTTITFIEETPTKIVRAELRFKKDGSALFVNHAGEFVAATQEEERWLEQFKTALKDFDTTQGD